MKTKHAHIIEAMRLPAVPVYFPKSATEEKSMITVTSGYLGGNMTMAKSCICCHLPIIGNGDHFCHRKTCVDIRAAAERQRQINEHGKFILQYETFDATTEVMRFDDEGECHYHADLIREQVADLFIINPDGSTVNFTAQKVN
ncbi:MAG: hypothetical protein ACRCXB_32430 [Aeromonadaceae bacterium]